jgi:hypothetical protein
MSALRDLKYLPIEHQQREIRVRALWTAIGAAAVLALLLAFGLVGHWDMEDELRVELAELERQRVHQVREAFQAGWTEGADSLMCWGLRVDRRTGQAVP